MDLNDYLPEFNLLGTDDRLHSTEEYLDKELIVVIFTCNHCPYARAYIERISAIVNEYESKSVGFYAINSNNVVTHPEDSFDRMKPMAIHLNLEGKYLYDETQLVAKAFSAERTPEVYVFNNERKLVYHGAIDDNWQHPNEVHTSFLKETLDLILVGAPVEIRETPAIGCSIKWKPV